MELIRIIKTDIDGFMLGNDTMRWSEPWSAVDQVRVARVPFGETRVLIALVSVDSVDGERSILMSEKDQNWHHVLNDLPRFLPDIEPFEAWIARPDIGSRGVVIYDRGGSR